jgi:hypothetical protein
MQCRLEPEFFACHLIGTEEYPIGDWQSPTVRPYVRAPIILPEYLRRAPFYTVEFRRLYYIPGGLKEAIELQKSITNMPKEGGVWGCINAYKGHA